MTSLASRLHRALSEPPHALALLRIAVPFVIVISPELHHAVDLARAPDRLTLIPEGLGVIARVPIGPGFARLLFVVALSSAATSILGYLSRASLVVLGLSAGLLFSLSQRSGAVLHDMHLFWFLAILAASPCADVWSIDAWGKPAPMRSERYGAALAFVRVLLGLVYFFPGLHKLLTSGFAWMTAENVTNHMRAKWLENARLPALRIDLAPTLCSIGAIGVVLFELGFLALALASRRTRWLALAGGLVFHVSTDAFFFIRFTSLMACYVVLLDGDLLARLTKKQETSDENASEKPPRPLLVIGAVLVAAVFVQGVRKQTQAWPVACYPTFDHLQGPTIPDIAVIVAKTDGSRVVLTGREKQPRDQAGWGHVFRISGAYGDAPNEALLRAHARGVLALGAIDPKDVTSVDVERVEVATAPERWNDPVPRGTHLVRFVTPL